MKRRHVLLILAFCALWVFLSIRQKQNIGSTYSYNSFGAAAFFLLLEEMKLPAARWFQPFNELPDGQNNLFFLIDPPKLSKENELLNWVRRGNTLVFFSSRLGDANGLDALLGFQTRGSADWTTLFSFKDQREGKFICPAEHPACAGVNQITLPWDSLGSLPSAFRSIADDEEGRSRAAFGRLGEGSVWVFADMDPISNAHIDRLDNLRLFYQLAQSAGAVYFDEFHHGYLSPVRKERRGSHQSLILMIACLVLALIVFALSRSVRFGLPRPPLPHPSTASTDFTAVLGLLYAEHKASEVLSQYHNSLRIRIERGLGLSRWAAEDELLREFKNLGVSNARLVGVKEALILLKEGNGSRAELESAVCRVEDLLTVLLRKGKKDEISGPRMARAEISRSAV